MKFRATLFLAAVSLLLASCATPATPVASNAPSDAGMQRAVHAVTTYYSRNSRWPVSLSEVGFTDRSYSYEADAAGFRIGHDGASYDSRR